MSRGRIARKRARRKTPVFVVPDWLRSRVHPQVRGLLNKGVPVMTFAEAMTYSLLATGIGGIVTIIIILVSPLFVRRR